MEQDNQVENGEAPNARVQFDNILVKHIRRLLEIETLETSQAFNLSSISCLLLLVERENEIKNFSASPPKRYVRETLLDDLSDIGLEIDDDLMVSFQALAQHGYVAINEDDHYYPQISAFALVGFLDNLFPGMTGLNLVGYILQMMKEVISSRKELQDALQQFDQTLFTQGIPLSRQKLKQDEKETLKEYVHKTLKTPESRKISEDLKLAFVQRLTKLRSREEGVGITPKVFQSTRPKAMLDVQDLFPKRSNGALNGQTVTVEEGKVTSGQEMIGLEGQVEKDAERMATQKMLLEAERKAAELSAREAEIKAAEIAAREAEIRLKETEIRAREVEMRARELEQRMLENQTEAPTDEIKLSNIEKKIEAFQEAMAMTCPLCHTGKIRVEETEKGRQYFSCSNGNCGFISWGKPYSFACPLCRNSFLIEFISGDNRIGLKCPRATCSFSQDHLGQPTQSQPGEDRAKKRRKLVRVRKK